MIFKKQICVFIAFLVLVSNSGLAFNIHFCEGSIASITSVFAEEEVCEVPSEKVELCCAKSQPTHQECCSDKEVNLKNKTEKVIIKSISFEGELIFSSDSYQALCFWAKDTFEYHSFLAYYCNAHAPPLYQLYCQYTFYA